MSLNPNTIKYVVGIQFFFVEKKNKEPGSPFFLAGRKQKQGWVSDTKVTSTTFDDLFEEDCRHDETVKHHRKDDKSDIRKAWATNVGVLVSCPPFSKT